VSTVIVPGLMIRALLGNCDSVISVLASRQTASTCLKPASSALKSANAKVAKSLGSATYAISVHASNLTVLTVLL